MKSPISCKFESDFLDKVHWSDKEVVGLGARMAFSAAVVVPGPTIQINTGPSIPLTSVRWVGYSIK